MNKTTDPNLEKITRDKWIELIESSLKECASDIKKISEKINEKNMDVSNYISLMEEVAKKMHSLALNRSRMEIQGDRMDFYRRKIDNIPIWIYKGTEISSDNSKNTGYG